MTDITELAQRMKAAAGKLGAAKWQTRKGFSGIEVIVKGSLERGAGCVSFQPVAADLADTKTARAIALFSPGNVIELVEALEKAKHEARVDWEAAASLNVESQELKRRIAELEEAEQKLCAANVTLDARAELAERRLAEVESRTVKMPEPFKLAKSSSGLTYYFADDVDAALTAAGIKWEAE